jgi:hypothetical protein
MKVKIFLLKLAFVTMMMSLQLKILQWRVAWKKQPSILDGTELFGLVAMMMTLVAGCIIAAIVVIDPSNWTPMLDLIGGMTFVAAGMFGMLTFWHSENRWKKIIG